MSGRFALIIGNTEYSDPGLAQLTAPGKDAEDFSRVLSNREICGFDEVKLLRNQPEHVVRGAIDEFFDQKKPDDLLVLYFSGHGTQEETPKAFFDSLGGLFKNIAFSSSCTPATLSIFGFCANTFRMYCLMRLPRL